MLKYLLQLFIFLLFSFITTGQELCTDGIDNDGDDLIDLFDPDCLCSDSAYQAQCSVDCQYIPDTFPQIILKEKWRSVTGQRRVSITTEYTLLATGDIDGNGSVEILTYMPDSMAVGVLDGSTGEWLGKIPIDQFDQEAGVTLADINGDGKSEIFLTIYGFPRVIIRAYDSDLNELWISQDLRPLLSPWESRGYHSNIADFNGDGLAEIYFSSIILNAHNGRVLAVGNEGKGFATNSTGRFSNDVQSIAADFLPDRPGLELAAGNTVYEIVINNTNGQATNSMIPHMAPSEVDDGRTAFGDIDGDELLDVITVSDRNRQNGVRSGTLWVWNPRDQSLIAWYTVPDRGIGIPFVGDMTGNCSAEVGFLMKDNIYTLQLVADSFQILNLIPNTDASGITGITMFDFNQDGRQEIVHRDQDSLTVYDGSTGQKLEAASCRSGTIYEYPVIADVDNDGQAEILTINQNFEVICYESGGAPWAPARSVWNQYGYHVTNINDDLTVPLQPQNTAVHLQGTENCPRDECSNPYNTYLAQATYRTQEGCVIWKASSLWPTISCIDYDYKSGIYIVTYTITNDDGSSLRVPGGMSISLFDGDPEMGGQLIALDTLASPLDIGETSAEQTITISTSVQTIYLVANTDRPASPLYSAADYGFVECDYSDNITMAQLPALTTEAIELCEGETYTLVDTIIADAGMYVRSIDGQDGCDSLIIELTVTAGSYISQTTTLTDCDSIVVAGTTYFESTTVSDTTTALTGCDTIDILELIVLQSTCSEIEMMACDTFVWSADGQAYTESGLYEYMTTNLVGCDSVVKLQLEIVESSGAEVALSDCDSVIYDGMTYLRDTMLFEAGSNLVGCDSTTTITIDVTSSASPTLITADACDSLSYDGMTYLRDTTLFRSLSGAEGCDSLVQLDITVRHSTMATVQEMACDTFVWSADGMTYRESGTYDFMTTNVVGCDSLMILELEVLASTIGSTSISACDSVTYDGMTYLRDTVLSETGINLVNCDSTTTITIDVISSASPTMLVERGCDSIVVSGLVYRNDTILQESFASVQGCDSAVVTEVSIQSSVQQSMTEKVCDSLVISGQVLSESGSYDLNYQTVYGCDSLLTLYLTIGGSVTEEAATACDTFVWLVNAASYTETGTYEQSYIDAVGCDSIHLLELTIESIYEATEVVTACDSYKWQRSEEILTMSGDYDYAVMSIDEACDSIYYLDLTISASYTDTLRVDTVDSYTWAVTGEEYSDGGLYVTSLTSIDGCDSTLVLDLTLRNEQTVANYSWPTIISPGSAANGAFTIYGDQAIASIRQLSVYDRWGSLVWRGADLPPSDPSIGWDGTAYGRPVVQGVYVWMAELELTTGEIIVEVGDVAVLR